jgi:hypothetical protein
MLAMFSARTSERQRATEAQTEDGANESISILADKPQELRSPLPGLSRYGHNSAMPRCLGCWHRTKTCERLLLSSRRAYVRVLGITT